MKLRFLIIIMMISLFLSGCSNSDSKNEIEKEPSNNTETELESDTNDVEKTDEEDGLDTLESLGEVETEKGLFTVEITFPSDFVGEATQEELNQTAEENGFKSITLNDDGSAIYVMTKDKHNELLEETRLSLETSLNEMVGSEDYPEIVSVESNNSFTEFIVVTKNQELSLSESFSVMALYMMGGMYGVIEGEEVDNINIKFINEATGEIISESNSKDM